MKVALANYVAPNDGGDKEGRVRFLRSHGYERGPFRTYGTGHLNIVLSRMRTGETCKSP
jgi:hypothetical protein